MLSSAGLKGRSIAGPTKVFFFQCSYCRIACLTVWLKFLTWTPGLSQVASVHGSLFNYSTFSRDRCWCLPLGNFTTLCRSQMHISLDKRHMVLVILSTDLNCVVSIQTWLNLNMNLLSSEFKLILTYMAMKIALQMLCPSRMIQSGLVKTSWGTPR